MKASAFFRIALVAPASLLVAVGAAAACPPESESRETPAPDIELGSFDRLMDLQSADGFVWSMGDPAMAVFQDGQTQKQNPFFGPGEGQPRIRVFRPSGAGAQAQTFTATRGNGQASAKARAELGEHLRRAQAEREDAMSVPRVPMKPAREVQGFRLKSPKRTATPPLPEPPEGFDAFVEGRAIVVGPDGQVREHVFSGNPDAPDAPAGQNRLRQGRSLLGAPRQDSVNQDEVMELERAAIAAAAAAPRVWIGVELAEPDASIVRYFDLQPGQTSEIAKVHEGSPAASAGLKDRDIVVKVNGAAMAGPDILREIVGAAQPGEEIRVTVLRKGRTHDLDLRPALREQPAIAAQGVPLSDPLGPAPAGKSANRDLEQRMDRIERMLEKLLENDARD